MKTQKHERGQSLVELSISLLVLLYLLSGAVEFGLAFFQFVQLRDAAQEGALYGSMAISNKVQPVTLDMQRVEQRVRSASTSPVNLADTTKVKVSLYVDDVLVWENGSPQGATNVACESHALKVIVSYPHQVFMPFMSEFIGNTVDLDATVTDTILTPICT
jgi:Flp pilus assembly protein TadG